MTDNRTDGSDLDGLDPYDLMDAETERLERFFAGLDDPRAWDAPSRCAGWSVRDVLAHLTATEEYTTACLQGTVAAFMQQIGDRGATDLATANEICIRDYDGQRPEAVLATWRLRSAENRRAFRARDGSDIDSSVGAYPARWQAFHLAFELATHAGDVGVPETPAEAPGRTAWQAQFGRFALKELKPDAKVEASGGRTRVVGDGVDVELDNTEFVQALAARLPDSSSLDEPSRAYLSATP